MPIIESSPHWQTESCKTWQQVSSINGMRNMSLMKTLAKVAIGVAVAKGAKHMMSGGGARQASAGSGGLGGLLGGLAGGRPLAGILRPPSRLIGGRPWMGEETAS